MLVGKMAERWAALTVEHLVDHLVEMTAGLKAVQMAEKTVA